MPILVAPAAPPPSGPVDGVRMISTPDWSWQSPSGTVRNLSRGVIYLAVGGVNGHLAPPVTMRDAMPATIDGGVYRGERYAPRDVTLGLFGYSRDPVEWRDAQRSLVSDFATGTGDGILAVAHVDGDLRMLACRYVQGLEQPVGGDPGAAMQAGFTVQLRAYDPWWYGAPITKTFKAQADVAFLPGPPFNIMPGATLGGSADVLNPGDVEAFPVWTVNGPCTSVTFTRDSDGATFTVTETLTAGEWFTVDTDPRASVGEKIVRDNGTNLWGVATTDFPNLWALEPGDSSITVTVAGQTNGVTSVDMTHNPRFRTA